MEPKIINPTDERWIAFITSHPSATLFHHPVWIQFLADCYNYQAFILAILNSSGEVTAGIPFVEINRILAGKRLVALPFTDHCTPLYTVDTLDPLLKSVTTLYKDTGAKELELRWKIPALPAAQNDSTHVLHTLCLEANASRVLGCFQPSNRRNLKTAQNSGLRVEWGTDEKSLRKFYGLHLETRHRKGVPIQPWRFFQLLGKEMLERGYGFVLLAYKEKTCIAASIFLHWRESLIYKFGASTENGLSYRPNNLVMWTAIQWGCENGYTLFDFGRTETKNEGLRRYKAGFGAHEIPLDYSILSDQMVSNRKEFFMKTMQYLIQHSPAWVCQVAGEALYRYAG